MTDYQELKASYDKLCAFLARVEDGSSPIHDDAPVAELYQQKAMMENMLAEKEVSLYRAKNKAQKAPDAS